MAGSSSTTSGFTMGANGNSNVIEQFSFSSNTTATDYGDLTVSMFTSTGQQY
jgi:hypothetical protein